MHKQIFPPILSLSLGITTLGSAVALGLEARAEAEPIWHNCLTREVFTPQKQAWCDRWQILQTATYIVPTSLDPDPRYTKVSLNNGRYQQKDGAFIVELVNQKGWLAFGDINADGKDDAAVIFGVALDPNGKAIATYLTAVLDIDGKAQALTPVKLGERILLNGPISVDRHRIHVPQLTSTEVINRIYTVDDTTLRESSAQQPGTVTASFPDGTLVFSQTSSYAVRVFTQNGKPKINGYNKGTGISELKARPVSVEPVVEGIAYHYRGKPAVRVTVSNSGAQTLAVNGKVLQDYAQVTGTVTYLPRIALPPEAILEVTLADVSRADAAAIILASQTIVFGNRQVPIPFALLYDPKQIDPRLSYAVQARITVNGRLRFINTTRTSVITQNNPTEVEIIIDPVSRSNNPFR